MRVQQLCHVPTKERGGFIYLRTPWDREELSKINNKVREIPGVYSGCRAPYPHTHHFLYLGE